MLFKRFLCFSFLLLPACGEQNSKLPSNTEGLNADDTSLEEIDASAVPVEMSQDIASLAAAKEKLPGSNAFTDTKSYYVDCGSAYKDTNSGLSPALAWKSLEAVYNKRSLIRPGDNIFLKRGCVFTGQLKLAFHGTAAKRIYVGPYGSGSTKPQIIGKAFAGKVVQIEGSYLIIDQLDARAAPGTNCEQMEHDKYSVGFNLVGEARYVQIQKSRASGNAVGVSFGTNTHHNRVTNSYIVQNNQRWTHVNVKNDIETFGPMGVLLHGKYQEIDHNTIADNTACADKRGSTIELYNAAFSHVHHNIAYRDRVFLETGTHATFNSTDNIFSYNLFYTDAPAVIGKDGRKYGPRFVVTRGVGHTFGPVYKTLVFNNTVYMPKPDSKGISCEKCGEDILSLRNNILLVEKEAVVTDAPFVESNNLYWSPNGDVRLKFTGFTMSSTSKIAAPKFVKPSTNHGSADFRLSDSSPAIDAGNNWNSKIKVYDHDLGGNTAPFGNTPRDIGAYEKQ